MARQKRTIHNILAQRERALGSINENLKNFHLSETNKYKRSQNRAFYTSGQALPQEGVGAFVDRKYNKRVDQINQAAQNQIVKLQQKGRDARAARKAQGLSVG